MSQPERLSELSNLLETSDFWSATRTSHSSGGRWKSLEAGSMCGGRATVQPSISPWRCIGKTRCGQHWHITNQLVSLSLSSSPLSSSAAAAVLASCRIYARALLEYVIIIVWVRSVYKMLPSVKFVEDKVLTFLILSQKC